VIKRCISVHVFITSVFAEKRTKIFRHSKSTCASSLDSSQVRVRVGVTVRVLVKDAVRERV
jgi:hypothetical protein